MHALISAAPVLVSAIIATFMPADILPHSAAQAFREGGWGMRPILFAFLSATWLAADRLIAVLRSSVDAYGFMKALKPKLEAQEIQGAIDYCRDRNRPLSRIILAGLEVSNDGAHAVRAAMDQAAYGEIPAIEKRTGYLALLGNVATLMGLFGTIVGLIHSFGAVSATNAQENATLLAAGISEAMNCTAFGLLAGIISLIAFSGLSGATQMILDDINLTTLSAYRIWKRARQSYATSAEAVDTERRPVSQPKPHLMSTVALLGSGAHVREKKSTFASLQLTPLIDMFIVLVIFLLLNFSATGEIVVADKFIKLPFAEEVGQLERFPIVSVSIMPDHDSGGLVSLENREVATVRELMEDQSPDWKIPRLTTALEARRDAWARTNPGQPFPAKVIVHCDQSVDFQVIKKIMYSAGVAGYGNFMFAVQKRPEKG